ncbi:hypothetical protein HAX54_031139, partial [Datura stramonium]|nr:hypothetical protein [Datura stramonium]
ELSRAIGGLAPPLEQVNGRQAEDGFEISGGSQRQASRALMDSHEDGCSSDEHSGNYPIFVPDGQHATMGSNHLS